MMMTVQQTAPFSGLLLFAVSRYSFPAVAKSAAGRRNPSYFKATPDAPCVFFYVVAQAHPFFGLWCLYLSPCQIMVVRAGQPSGWPVSLKAGIPTPVRATTHERRNSGGGNNRYFKEVAPMATTLTPPPPRSLSLCLPPFVALTVNPVFVCSAPLPVMNTPHAFPLFVITSSRSLAVCRLRRCTHEKYHYYRP